MRGGEATQRDNQPMSARQEMTTSFNGEGGGVGGGGWDPARARGTRWVRRGRRRTPPVHENAQTMPPRRTRLALFFRVVLDRMGCLGQGSVGREG